jgi:hypothetical protein
MPPCPSLALGVLSLSKDVGAFLSGLVEDESCGNRLGGLRAAVSRWVESSAPGRTWENACQAAARRRARGEARSRAADEV